MELCEACENAPESYRCPACGLTGPEIWEREQQEQTG
jgi:hypothetical protein